MALRTQVGWLPLSGFQQRQSDRLQSKAGQPLGRYFPEIVDALRGLPVSKFVLDGEIVIRRRNGLDFNALLQRIHPAASRIQRLSQETPATYMVFDLLVDAQGRAMTARPLAARRMALQEFAARYLGASAAGKGRKAATPKTAKSARLARSRGPANHPLAGQL